MRVAQGLTALETAAGGPVGWVRMVSEAPAKAAPAPWAALKGVLRRALLDPPCRVAFSGGRDSSLLLAAAVHAAREEGLPAPVPVILRFPGVPSSAEGEWQELVLRALGVDDALHVELDAELDLLGAAAAPLLREHGPYFPPNAHSMLPLIAARPGLHGGTLVVGFGGDEVLGAHRWHAVTELAARRRRPSRSDPARLALATLPRRARGLLHQAGTAFDADPWLQPRAARRLALRELTVPDEPVPFDRAVLQTAQRRNVRVGMATFGAFAASAGVSLHVPLADPVFVHAFARAGGRTGFGGRAGGMRAVAAGILPDALLARRDKATFTGAFYGPRSLAFAREWSGQGLDGRIVDPEAVRRSWLADRPAYRSAMLLQAAWLHEQGSAARAG